MKRNATWTTLQAVNEPNRSGWNRERIVAQKPRHGRIQLPLSLRLRLRLHGDVFGCPGVGPDVLGDQRHLLPLQPVSHHVTFPLVGDETETRWVLVSSGGGGPVSDRTEGRDSPWPAAFLCTAARSRRSPPAGKRRWSCTGSSGLQRQQTQAPFQFHPTWPDTHCSRSFEDQGVRGHLPLQTTSNIRRSDSFRWSGRTEGSGQVGGNGTDP